MINSLRYNLLLKRSKEIARDYEGHSVYFSIYYRYPITDRLTSLISENKSNIL